jgi:hypothetical protein
VSRAVAVAAAALALAGCGGSAPGPPLPPSTASPLPVAPGATATVAATPPGDAAALQVLLDRRAAALDAEDTRAYANTATAASRPADRSAAGRAAALGLRDVRLTAEDVQLAGRRARLEVRLAYGIRGVRGTFGGVRAERARRTGRGWRLTGPAGTRDRQPWEADAYARIATTHFVVWMPEGLDAGPLTASLEQGYGLMRDALRAVRLRRRYLVVVARDAARARALTREISGLDGLTALTDTEVRQAGAAERVTSVTSQRLLVVWANFLPLDPQRRLTAVTHELTHAALAPRTSGRLPGWLAEGTAMYVSGDDRSQEAAQLLDQRVIGSVAGRRALTLRALSRPDAIARLEGEAQREAYAYASAAAHRVVAVAGRRGLLDLYDAFGRDDVRGRRGDPALTDAALRQALGVSLQRFERGLRRSLADRPAF